MMFFQSIGRLIGKSVIVILAIGLFGGWNLIYAFFHGYTIHEFFHDAGMVFVGMAILLFAVFGLSRIKNWWLSIRQRT